ncbi:uncharacterized protein LOC142345339 isoform X2 [Convolutriloba macropyga]|uniref:uncharacterized protein LOC142345339 isoform X2 n=1 Tax=Convolutriloba macropyga TaxID=536237 RepID=UPI003F51E399
MEDKVTICFDRFKFSDSQNLTYNHIESHNNILAFFNFSLISLSVFFTSLLSFYCKQTFKFSSISIYQSFISAGFHLFWNFVLFYVFGYGLAFGNLNFCGLLSVRTEFYSTFSDFERLHFVTHFAAYHLSFTVVEICIMQVFHPIATLFWSLFHGFAVMVPVFWGYSSLGVLARHFATIDCHGSFYILCTSVICLVITISTRLEKGCQLISQQRKLVHVAMPCFLFALVVIISLSMLLVQNTTRNNTLWLLAKTLINFTLSSITTIAISLPFTIRLFGASNEFVFNIILASLAGIVSVASSAAVIDFWSAPVFGVAAFLATMASSKTTKAFKIESRDVILALFLPAFFGLILGSVFANSDAEIFGKPKGLIFSGSNGLKFLLGQLLWPICATIWTASLSSVFAIVAKHSCLLSSQFRPSLQQDNQPQLVEKICEAADANCEPETNSDYEEARTHRKLKSLGKELTLSSKEDLENVRHPTKHDIDGGFKIRQSRDPRFQSLAASLGNYYTSLDHQSFHMHSGVIEGKDDSQKSMLFPYDYLYSHSNNGYKNNHHKYSQLNQYGQNITLTDKEEIRLSRYGSKELICVIRAPNEKASTQGTRIDNFFDLYLYLFRSL